MWIHKDGRLKRNEHTQVARSIVGPRFHVRMKKSNGFSWFVLVSVQPLLFWRTSLWFQEQRAQCANPPSVELAVASIENPKFVTLEPDGTVANTTLCPSFLIELIYCPQRICVIRLVYCACGMQTQSRRDFQCKCHWRLLIISILFA